MVGPILLVVIFVLVLLAWPLLMVRFRAASRGLKDVSLYGGMVRYVMWEPNEGVIILRNKKKQYIDQTGEGGSKFIYSILGEEALPRVPLSTSSVDWQEDVSTKESIQVSLKCVILYKVTDIYKYHFGANKALNISEKNKNVLTLDIYQRWILAQADSAIRTFASRASISELVSLESIKHNHMENENLKFSNISELILTEFNRGSRDMLDEFGIRVTKIDVQSILVNSRIQEEINKVWISYLKPVQSEQEAKARQIELEALARTLGTDTVKLTEILKHMNLQGTNILSDGGLMSSLFREIGKTAGKAMTPPQQQPDNLLNK